MFHLRCITLCFAFSLMPPCHLFQVTSGSLHVTFCSRLFPVCFHTEANTGSQSVACLLPQTRILFICMHVSFTCVACLVLHCLCMAFFGGFQFFFFFVFDYQRNSPFPFRTCVFTLLSQVAFLKVLYPPGP